MDNAVSKNTKALREARSWTQVMLADKANVSERCIQRAEAGNPISAENLLDIATALEVTPEDLRRDHDAEELERLKKRFDLIPLEELSSPAVFIRCADGCMALQFEMVSDPPPDIHEQLMGFQGFIRDYLDINGELTPSDRLAVVREAHEQWVVAASRLGWTMSAAAKTVRMRPQDGGEAFTWSVLVVVAAPSADAKTHIVWDREQPIQFGM